jgi:hypothetical protein
MVLATPGPLLTPPPSSSPPKTPFRSYSVQIRSQNEEKNQTPQTIPAPTDENWTWTITQTPSYVHVKCIDPSVPDAEPFCTSFCMFLTTVRRPSSAHRLEPHALWLFSCLPPVQMTLLAATAAPVQATAAVICTCTWACSLPVPVPLPASLPSVSQVHCMRALACCRGPSAARPRPPLARLQASHWCPKPPRTWCSLRVQEWIVMPSANFPLIVCEIALQHVPSVWKSQGGEDCLQVQGACFSRVEPMMSMVTKINLKISRRTNPWSSSEFHRGPFQTGFRVWSERESCLLVLNSVTCTQQWIVKNSVPQMGG